MITESLALKVYICHECNSMMIGSPASSGPPNACQKCGTPANVELTQEDRMKMEAAQRQQQSRQSFNIRMG